MNKENWKYRWYDWLNPILWIFLICCIPIYLIERSIFVIDIIFKETNKKAGEEK